MWVGEAGLRNDGDELVGTLRMRDLVKATGATARAIRFYVERGLLPRAEGRGTGLNYNEEHLVRLRAVRRLRAQRLDVDQMLARLGKMSADDIARLGAPPPPPAAPGPAPGPAAPARPYPAERWERVALLPGLELHVRGDAGPLVRRIAAEIHERYSAAAAPEGAG